MSSTPHWRGQIFETTIYLETTGPGLGTFATREEALDDLARRVTEDYQAALSRIASMRAHSSENESQI